MHAISGSQALLAALALATVSNGMPLSAEELMQQIKARQDAPADTGVQKPYTGLPSCSSGLRGADPTDSQDPTWIKSKSKHKDGEGFHLGTDCDNSKGDAENLVDAKDPQHCWTDYYLVGWTQKFGQWYSAGEANCDNSTGVGTNCGLSNIDTKQSCQTYKWEVSEAIGFNFGVEAEGISVGFSSTTTTSTGQDDQQCKSNQHTETCTWGQSGGCHAAYFTPLIYNVEGYMRRSCNSALLGGDDLKGLPYYNTPKREDGFYTRGIQDFTIPVVNSNHLDCNRTCTEGTPPPQTAPPDGDKLKPWPAAGFALDKHQG